MKLIVLCCVCVLAVAGQEQDIEAMRNLPKYDSRYDYLDVDAIFNSKRLVKNYVECLVNGTRCTPEGKALRKLLPEALRTKCVRCTERQKKIAVKIIRRLKKEFPEEWAKLSARWDPTGDFTRYFEVYLAREQFNTISGNGNEISPPEPPQFIPLASAPPSPPPAVTPATTPTPPTPVVLNRFGDEETMDEDSSSVVTTTPIPTMATTAKTERPPTTKAPIPPRPTPVSWASVGANSVPTHYTLRPTNQIPTVVYTTAITLIDQIGIKIIRTTELVTDILKNTVRAVVG